MFFCDAGIQPYKCVNCDYSSHEKCTKFEHICGIKDRVVQGHIRQCSRCKVGSFSIAWHYFHQIRCVSGLNLLSRNQQGNKLFRCKQCSFKTYVEEKLNKHVFLSQHNLDNIKTWLQCDYCPFSCVNVSALKNHTNLRHNTTPPPQKLYCCDQCSFKTKHRNSLKYHKSSRHRLEQINLYKCDQCQYQTLLKCHLKKHQARIHITKGLETEFKCDQCWYNATHKGYLELHKKRQHAIQ